MMNPRQMEVFHAIMSTGSVTAAARMLNVTQPAVSAVLKECEAGLGLKLFERAGGRMKPTAEAHAIFPDIAGIFSRLADVQLRLGDLAAAREGRLEVAGAFPLANSHLARAVARFVSERPKVHVDLHSLTSPQVVDRVVAREVELGLVYGPVSNSEIETETLLRSAIGCVMHESHPLAGRSQVRIEDLASHALITYLPQTVLRARIDDAFQEAGVTPDLRVQVSISITGAVLAHHGVGIALVEPHLVEAMGVPGLVSRPLRPAIGIETLLVHLRSTPPSRLALEFVACLRETVRPAAA